MMECKREGSILLSFPRLEGVNRGWQGKYWMMLAGWQAWVEAGSSWDKYLTVPTIPPDTWGLSNTWGLESDQTETQHQLRKLSRLNQS